MPHALISGMTETGKSTLAKAICRQARRKHHLTVVLDKLMDPAWECDYFTTDPADLMRFLSTHKRAFVFIDEAGWTFDKFDKKWDSLTTLARHAGHSIYLICQFLTQLSPTLRGNCRDVYLFTASATAFKVVAEEFNQPELLRLPRLERGQFYKVSKFSEISKYSIDFRTGRVRVVKA